MSPLWLLLFIPSAVLVWGWHAINTALDDSYWEDF